MEGGLGGRGGDTMGGAVEPQAWIYIIYIYIYRDIDTYYIYIYTYMYGPSVRSFLSSFFSVSFVRLTLCARSFKLAFAGIWCRLLLRNAFPSVILIEHVQLRSVIQSAVGWARHGLSWLPFC